MRLAVGVYELTRKYPKCKLDGLAGQMRRSALSVASNIAEGHGRDHLGDYLRHLSISKGSLAETETHLFASRAVAKIPAKDIDPLLALCQEVGRMLSVLTRKLRLRLRSHSKKSGAPSANAEPPTPST
jgi:four helix bundle protein